MPSVLRARDVGRLAERGDQLAGGFLAVVMEDAVADFGGYFVARFGCGWPATGDFGEVEAPVASEDRADFPFIEREDDEVEFLHVVAAAEPAEVDEFIFLVGVGPGEGIEVGPGACFRAERAEELVDGLAVLRFLDLFEEVGGADFLRRHEFPEVGVVPCLEVGWGGFWFRGPCFAEEKVDPETGADVIVDEVFRFRGEAGGGEELIASTVFADEGLDACGDVFLGYGGEAAFCFLIEEDAGDDVIAGVLAEFGIAFAAGDARHAFVVRFDVLEFLLEDFRGNGFAVDGEWHKVAGGSVGEGLMPWPEFLEGCGADPATEGLVRRRRDGAVGPEAL